MIPLVLLAALGLGLAITAAGDQYARASRAAAAAHIEADARLASASAAASVASQQMLAAISAQQAAALAVPPPSTVIISPATPVVPPSPPPSQAADAHADAAQRAVDAAVEHSVAATQANQSAAQSTADMAKSAKTAEEKAAAAASAAAVLERERKIAALGVGQCGVRSYAHVNARAKDQLVAKLHAAGMSVTGTNPWDIDTHKYGVRLRAVWSPVDEVLKLIVITGKGTEVIPFFKNVTCDDIWNEIDPDPQAGHRHMRGESSDSVGDVVGKLTLGGAVGFALYFFVTGLGLGGRGGGEGPAPTPTPVPQPRDDKRLTFVMIRPTSDDPSHPMQFRSREDAKDYALAEMLSRVKAGGRTDLTLAVMGNVRQGSWEDAKKLVRQAGLDLWVEDTPGSSATHVSGNARGHYRNARQDRRSW